MPIQLKNLNFKIKKKINKKRGKKQASRKEFYLEWDHFHPFATGNPAPHDKTQK